MKKRTAIAAALIVALTAGGTAIAAKSGSDGWQRGDRMEMMKVRRGGHHGGPGFCHMMRGERMAGMIDVVEAFVDFTPEQQTAWGELTTAMTNARESLADQCRGPGAMAEQDGKRSPMDAMDRMETRLEAQLEALRTVRPAAEAFWNTLSQEQRQALQGLMKHRRGPGMGMPDDT